MISLSNENLIETQPEFHVKEKTVTHIVVTQFNVPCKGGIPSTILPAKQGIIAHINPIFYGHIHS